MGFQLMEGQRMQVSGGLWWHEIPEVRDAIVSHESANRHEHLLQM